MMSFLTVVGAGLALAGAVGLALGAGLRSAGTAADDPAVEAVAVTPTVPTPRAPEVEAVAVTSTVPTPRAPEVEPRLVEA